LEQRVKERTAALEATNKELESFSYSVSHDLRGPLRGIAGFSELLKRKYTETLDDQGKTLLQLLQTNVDRMQHLIQDLLNLAQVARVELRRERVNLSSLVGQVAVEFARREPERNVTVSAEPDVVATGDPGLLRIVIENLLGNAWKFTGTRAEAKIEFGATRHDGQRTYFIRDNGIGFDMTQADRLFVAFQRLASGSEFPGTGVGLTTVQRIIHRHGGRIWAEAKVNEGATFYFTLPES
jgi:light-regulated signal transduction histidine kinase (bacteriophytochrome)